ncbi:MAG: hypothetical protein OEU36_09965 [Gammaproteobacteria bacterium]|nr:hypothetical protein [Gammaproteobacteria bacterium]
MAYTLNDFIGDCRQALLPDNGPQGREHARRCLEKLLVNEEFVSEHCGPAAPAGIHTLYQDDELDFVVLAHIYDTAKTSPPHDHGNSWAIYGQAVLYTDMTVWERVDDQSEQGHAELTVKHTYRLNPGMAGLFEPGDIHSIEFPKGARFVRVTGTDLKRIATQRYDLENKQVMVNPPT